MSTRDYQRYLAQQAYLAEQQRIQAALEQQSAQQAAQQQGSPVAQGAGMAGQAAGMYAGNSIFGGGSAAAGAGTAATTAAAPVGVGTNIGAALAPGASTSGYTLGATSAGSAGAGAGGGAAAAPSMFSLANVGSAGNVVLPALGVAGAANLIQHQGDAPRGGYARGIGQGAASGAAIGSYFGPWGALIGAGVGGLAGGIGAATGSGKDQAQMNRDKLRKALIGAGISDATYKINGLDIGVDGGSKELKNLGTNIDGTKTRHVYDVDFSNPLSGGTISVVAPLTKALLGGQSSGKQYDDLNGMITNAVMNGAKDQATINKNLAGLYAKVGMKPPAMPKGAVPSLNAPGVTFGDTKKNQPAGTTQPKPQPKTAKEEVKSKK